MSLGGSRGRLRANLTEPEGLPSRTVCNALPSATIAMLCGQGASVNSTRLMFDASLGEDHH